MGDKPSGAVTVLRISDRFFLLFLTEKLTGEKLDVPEVTQSEEGQKQKLGIVLEATNRVSLSTPSFLSLLATNQHRQTYYRTNQRNCRSQWPHGLRRRPATARLLRLWVQIPLEAWTSVYCECCVSSGRGPCDGPITRPEESYQLWFIIMCDLETSLMRKPWPTWGYRAKNKLTKLTDHANEQETSLS